MCEAQTPSKCLYASPAGSGNGSAAAPGSLASVLAQASAGDFVYLLAGTYSDIVDMGGTRAIINLEKDAPRAHPLPTAEAPLVIKGYPGHVVVLQGDFSSTCVLIDRRAHYRFEDFAIRDCLNHAIQLGLDLPMSHIAFRNIEISQVRYVDNAGFLTIDGYSDVVIDNLNFHDYETGNPAGTGYYLKLFRARNITVQASRFHGAGGGIYYKHGENSAGLGGYTRIVGNHFYNLSSGRGIALNQNRAEVIGNLLEEADIGLHFEDGTLGPFTQQPRIAYNTLIGGSITLNEGSDSYIPGTPLGVFDAVVERNLLYGSGYSIWHYGSDSQHALGVGLNSNNNCFFRESNDPFISYFGAGQPWGTAGALYRFSDWQAQGFDTASIFADPELDSVYRPSPSSACRSMGHTALRSCGGGPDTPFCDGFELP
ncbi:hypothetical protein [Pseudomarimonas arenosa]|uniref:Right handed beta helix domain-containing protein n=1 Tax=Pseudomarimonas arenosa TaxID=2774145 RepID=A0AAW3ZJP7_9GAMM|nr:hypothetical protein [Pseudomarimonas arenosa]MBD8526216.1 hypothetical protein [Pseudomarimonas arenosa]